MSLFCRSSWILPFSKVSTSLTKKGKSIKQSFVLGSFALSVSILFVFLRPSFFPSFLPSFNRVPKSPFCRSSWILPFIEVSTSHTKLGTSTNQSINHLFWTRSVSQPVVYSSSSFPPFLPSSPPPFLPSFLPSFLHSIGCHEFLVLQEQLNSSFQ